MVTKFLKFIGLFLLLTTLTGCSGGDEDCIDYGAIARVDDLLTLLPLQSVFNQGDVVTFKISIPATNNFFGEQINLLENTNDFEARLQTTYSNLFSGNNLLFVSGSQAEYSNWFNVTYNSINEVYELEIKMTLNKTGSYKIITNDYILFQGDSKCNRYRLDTNILHNEPGPGIIEFTVQ
ncbi:hypothetical protein [Flavobacterium sp.]|jgi:hypothetical protein|uniref:hypothetical protein n=1 Tax=Flavobacterium sp. TaxID=239 RepID=UPI0037C1151B